MIVLYSIILYSNNYLKEGSILQNDYDEVSNRMSEIYYQGVKEEIVELEKYLLRIVKNLDGGNKSE